MTDAPDNDDDDFADAPAEAIWIEVKVPEGLPQRVADKAVVAALCMVLADGLLQITGSMEAANKVAARVLGRAFAAVEAAKARAEANAKAEAEAEEAAKPRH